MSAERIIAIDLTGTSVIRVKRYENGLPAGNRLCVKSVKFGDRDDAPAMVCRLQNAVYHGVEAEAQMHKQGAVVERGFTHGVGEGDEHAEALYAQYLAYLGEKYREQSKAGYLGEPEDTECAILCCPAAWNESARIYISWAAQRAGFADVRIMEKEIAQVLAALVIHEEKVRKMRLLRSHKSSNILLLHMGEETAEASLCRCTLGSEPWLEHVVTWPRGGDASLGGRQIDLKLMKLVEQMLPAQYASTVVKACGEHAFRRWKEREIAPALATDGMVTSFSDLECLLPDGENTSILINREQFEKLMQPYLRGLVDTIGGCLKAGGVPAAEVDLVVLAGGGSQWYFVRSLLEGKMPGFGDLGLERISRAPERVLGFERPQDAAALGMAFSGLNIESLAAREYAAKVQKNGLWGMIDEEGREFIPCKWKQLYSFHEGFVWARGQNQWCLIDDTGKERFVTKASEVKDVQEGAFVARMDNYEVHFDLKKSKNIGYKWTKAESFRNGVAQVEHNGKHGYVNRDGERLGESLWDETYGFCEGFACVRSGKKWGYIDQSGKLIGKCEWDEAEGFENGVARVSKGKRVGFIDRTGMLLGGKLWDYAACEMHDGLIWVAENGKKGFIDAGGKLVIPCKYSFCGDFDNGYAVVSDGRGYGMIDQKGNLVIGCEWEDISSVRGGFARVKNKANKWHYTDVPRGSRPELSNRYNPLRSDWDTAEAFYRGVAKVSKQDEWGLLNERGQLVGRKLWQAVGTMIDCSDYVPVAYKDKWGYLNYKTGELAVECAWSAVSNVMRESACVVQDGRWGIINREGVLLSGCQWDEIRFFMDGELGAMLLNGQWGLITHLGKVVSDCRWDEHKIRWSGFVAVRKGERWALFSPEGKQIAACEWEKIHDSCGGFFRVEKDGRYGYIGEDGKTLIACQYDEAEDFSVLL